MTREEFVKQRCEIDKITEAEFEKTYRVVDCNCGAPYCKGYRCLDLDGLLKENQELKQKYLNAVADYETTMFEKEQLNSLVNSCQEEIRQLKKQLEELKEEKQEWVNLLDMFKTQQKEFINYMNDIIKELESEDVNDEDLKGYIIQRIGAFKEILQKYKSIIGGNYDNNTTL